MKNEYEVCGATVVIHIYRKNGEHYKTYISIEDLPRVLAWHSISWCIYDNTSQRGGYYVYCRIPGTKPQRNISMHRFIMEAVPGSLIDHINGNTLDNRRSNLRVVTDQENNQNRNRVNRNSKSGVRGVAWHKPLLCWRAYLNVDGKHKHLGLFSTIEAADAAVKAARAKHYPCSKEGMSVNTDAKQEAA